MAGKQNKGKAKVEKPIGFWGHGYVAPSMATLLRRPLAPPANGKAKAKAPGEDRQAFVLGLLEQATEGLTWSQIQAELISKFGQAPKKRGILYDVLKDKSWHKTTEDKGIVRYFLGKAKRRKSK